MEAVDRIKTQGINHPAVGLRKQSSIVALEAFLLLLKIFLSFLNYLWTLFEKDSQIKELLLVIYQTNNLSISHLDMNQTSLSFCNC